MQTQPITIEALWDQLHTGLGRFICSRLSDCDDADDILQDVFIRIHAHLETVRELDKLESWIYQIARNAIADYYRSRHPWVELEDFPVEDEMDEVDTAESLAPYIRDVVQSLPERYREALLLTAYQGLSQQQLAERLGISLSGAKSRVQRARQKVRDVMLCCCHFELDAYGLVYEVRERCCKCGG